MWPVDGASIRIRSTGTAIPRRRTTSRPPPHSCPIRTSRSPTKAVLHSSEPAHPHPSASANLRSLRDHSRVPLRHRFASRLASNSVVQYALWLQGLSPQHHERLIRWCRTKSKAPAKCPSSPSRPSPKCCASAAHRCRPPAAMAGGPHPHHCRRLRSAAMLLGLERDVNRNTAALSRMMLFAPPSSRRAPRRRTPHSRRHQQAPRLDDLESFSPTWMRLTNWNRRKSSKSSSAAACLPSTRSAA